MIRHVLAYQAECDGRGCSKTISVGTELDRVVIVVELNEWEITGDDKVYCDECKAKAKTTKGKRR